jgi:uncharacterized phage protein (TIGR01671 family)
MKEIKFRGKTCNDNVWVYGQYLESTISWTNRKPHKSWIVPTSISNGGFIAMIQRYPVIDETIGQYTGLQDENGVEIYEGDVMQIPATEFNIEIIGVVEFDKGKYVVRSFFSGTHSSLAWAVRERQSGERRGVVIGNIHDNPELLKGE